MKLSLRPHPLTRPAHGFTLMEVIIAGLVMGLMMLALGMVMRLGVRSWRTGHGASEIFQTARVAQDMIVRDMDNMVYLHEGDYNKTFRGQKDAMEQALNNNLRDPKSAFKDGEMSPENIAPPIDLSFRGTDGGKTDQLSFVRSQTPRLEGDANSWGMRRVSYYIKDKVLYRKETSPFGFRNTQGLPDPSTLSQSDYEKIVAKASFEKLFAAPDADPAADESETTYDKYHLVNLDLKVSMPPGSKVDEPLCEGVEIFDISYGYFQQGEWVEVKDWDSQGRHYRNPPDETDGNQKGPRVIGQPGVDPVAQQPMGANGIQIDNNSPDDLPGFVAIQLGVRGADGKGRLYSYTIFHSLPLAQETDIMKSDDDKGLRPRDGRRHPPPGKSDPL